MSRLLLSSNSVPYNAIGFEGVVPRAVPLLGSTSTILCFMLR